MIWITNDPAEPILVADRVIPLLPGTGVIVKDFTRTFAAGEFIMLIGHSGCGKSTVLSMVAGLTDVTDGAMILAGRETNEAGPDRVVFQSPCLLPWMTAFENVMLDSLTRMELQEVLLDLWRRNKLTTLIVTHDVDEAIFLSERVVMMTYGPEAEVGDILTIPFAHPRVRVEVMADLRYLEIRNHLLTFLNERSHIRPSRIAALRSGETETAAAQATPVGGLRAH